MVGVGSMSINSINATVDLAKYSKLPLMLIPSRRQIDRNEGYVGNLIQSSFLNYLKNKKILFYVEIMGDLGKIIMK